MLFFERPASGGKALLVHVETPRVESSPGEFRELAVSAALDVAGEVAVRCREPNPRTYIGSGKLDEVRLALAAADAEMVLFDQDLSPTQERNLERELERRVVGRSGLILDIFAQRARTHEGKLQVELAQLHHMSARLVRGWTHLDRQRGGGRAAGVQGAGETQLEADQRIVGQRISKLSQRLDKVRRQRSQNRRARSRAEIPTVSLVGYTNAGKSTLFNRLCESEVFAADQLFATLDPTLRRLRVDGVGEVILTDTVGFIRKLPHTLIEAFRATLEEVREADLLLHVVDAAAEERQRNMADVDEVLEEIGATDARRLIVCNKIDLLGESPRIDVGADGKPWRVWVSALDGRGFELIGQALAECLSEELVTRTVTLPASAGKARARFYELGAVIAEEPCEDGGQRLEVRMPRNDLCRLSERYHLEVA